MYRQITVGEWFRVPMRGHVDACCDCGLVHVLKYRIVNVPHGKKRRDTLEMQVVKIDRRATAARRRPAVKTRRIVAKRARATVAGMEKRARKSGLT
jgi:hypothetical protein